MSLWLAIFSRLKNVPENPSVFFELEKN